MGFIFQFHNLVPSLTTRENVKRVTEIARNPMKPGDELTTLVITHNAAVATTADRVVDSSNGVIVSKQRNETRKALAV